MLALSRSMVLQNAALRLQALRSIFTSISAAQGRNHGTALVGGSPEERQGDTMKLSRIAQTIAIALLTLLVAPLTLRAQTSSRVLRPTR